MNDTIPPLVTLDVKTRAYSDAAEMQSRRDLVAFLAQQEKLGNWPITSFGSETLTQILDQLDAAQEEAVNLGVDLQIARHETEHMEHERDFVERERDAATARAEAAERLADVLASTREGLDGLLDLVDAALNGWSRPALGTMSDRIRALDTELAAALDVPRAGGETVPVARVPEALAGVQYQRGDTWLLQNAASLCESCHGTGIGVKPNPYVCPTCGGSGLREPATPHDPEADAALADTAGDAHMEDIDGAS